MTCVVSDTHGRYDKYAALLKKIDFGDNDKLYVLGDVIDRYDDGIKIMLDRSFMFVYYRKTQNIQRKKISKNPQLGRTHGARKNYLRIIGLI